MRRVCLLILALLLPAVAGAQDYDLLDSDAPEYDYDEGEPVALLRSLRLVDSPTAVVLRHAEYRITGRIMANGSVIAMTEVGIKDRFSVGVAWGMQGLLGRGDVEVNDNAGVSVRLLLVEELDWPSLVIGFDSQGYGPWYEDQERYERKSKGFFACLTRNWYGPMGSNVATTGGMNYSFEDKDDSSIDAFVGGELEFGGTFAFVGEFSLGLNDNKKETPAVFGQGSGWLDAGLRWTIRDTIQFKFFLRDLMGNYRGYGPVDRQLELSYQGNF